MILFLLANNSDQLIITKSRSRTPIQVSNSSHRNITFSRHRRDLHILHKRPNRLAAPIYTSVCSRLRPSYIHSGRGKIPPAFLQSQHQTINNAETRFCLAGLVSEPFRHQLVYPFLSCCQSDRPSSPCSASSPPSARRAFQ